MQRDKAVPSHNPSRRSGRPRSMLAPPASAHASFRWPTNEHLCGSGSTHFPRAKDYSYNKLLISTDCGGSRLGTLRNALKFNLSCDHIRAVMPQATLHSHDSTTYPLPGKGTSCPRWELLGETFFPLPSRKSIYLLTSARRRIRVIEG